MDAEQVPSLCMSATTVALGPTMLPRAIGSGAQPSIAMDRDAPLQLLNCQAQALEALAVYVVTCTHMGEHCYSACTVYTVLATIRAAANGWMGIVVGAPGTGKTCIIRCLAALAGRSLVELSLTAGSDTSDLLGGFEQVEATKESTVRLTIVLTRDYLLL